MKSGDSSKLEDMTSILVLIPVDMNQACSMDACVAISTDVTARQAVETIVVPGIQKPDPVSEALNTSTHIASFTMTRQRLFGPSDCHFLWCGRHQEVR